MVLCSDDIQILGNMKKGPQSLMLISVVMNLRKLGYALKVICFGCSCITSLTFLCRFWHFLLLLPNALLGYATACKCHTISLTGWCSLARGGSLNTSLCVSLFKISMAYMLMWRLHVLLWSSTKWFMRLTIPFWQIYAVDNGVTRSVWEEIGGRISILGPEQYDHIDWSMYDSFS
jgi:hypothetical protein